MHDKYVNQFSCRTHFFKFSIGTVVYFCNIVVTACSIFFVLIIFKFSPDYQTILTI